VPRNSFLAFITANQIDCCTRLKAAQPNVIWIKKNHPASVANTAIPIVQSIDRRIELIVTAHRHHQEFSRLQINLRQRMNCEMRQPVFADRGADGDVRGSVQYVDMTTAKIFQHGGSQAVRLPRAFRFDGTEVLIEKRGDEVVLKPVPTPKFRSFTEIARYLAEKFPDGGDFPEPPTRLSKPKIHGARRS